MAPGYTLPAGQRPRSRTRIRSIWTTDASVAGRAVSAQWIRISVTKATHSPASVGAPSGTSPNRSRQMGSTITAISISTVPDTVGVITRRSCGSLVAICKEKERRHNHQAGQHRWPSLIQGEHRQRDVVGSHSHDDQMPRAKSTYPGGLQRGDYPYDYQRSRIRTKSGYASSWPVARTLITTIETASGSTGSTMPCMATTKDESGVHFSSGS